MPKPICNDPDLIMSCNQCCRTQYRDIGNNKCITLYLWQMASTREFIGNICITGMSNYGEMWAWVMFNSWNKCLLDLNNRSLSVLSDTKYLHRSVRQTVGLVPRYAKVGKLNLFQTCKLFWRSPCIFTEAASDASIMHVSRVASEHVDRRLTLFGFPRTRTRFSAPRPFLQRPGISLR